MLKLKEVRVQKYKCYSDLQTVSIENDITTIVGKNESGKTAFLEAIAKVNYFQDDEDFKLNVITDYPRKDLTEYKRKQQAETAVWCRFEIPKELFIEIQKDLGENVFTIQEFEYSIGYNANNTFIGLSTNQKNYLHNLYDKFKLGNEVREQVCSYNTIEEFLNSPTVDIDTDDTIDTIKSFLKNQIISKSDKDWDDKLASYIAFHYLRPNMPKFWYYDEYYALPSRINLNHLRSKNFVGSLNPETYKTTMALFDLANIDLEELLNATNFESYLAELEATSNYITDKMFDYWTTNNNIEIKFEIDTLESSGEKVLDIRIRNQKHRVSLPLSNRSKGFNWFFSFIVWFSKIQNSTTDLILLLDEPGLNLHASAQADLLRFIKDLSKEYQIIYTTHSPFMIDSNNLQRTRTVLDTDKGTYISDAIKERDTDTLFPLQAALGYDIAQNLFISKNNLLVEGPADLLYLTVLSNILENDKRQGLSSKFTIIPTGGLDKVASFISLMRGNKLNVICLLDSFNNKGKQRLDNLIQNKIIKESNVHFFDEFTSLNKADIEDMFTKEEYLKIFNNAFNEYDNIEISQIEMNNSRVISQINTIINGEFNHYKPAYQLAQMGVGKNFFSEETLTRFENMFNTINQLIS